VAISFEPLLWDGVDGDGFKLMKPPFFPVRGGKGQPFCEKFQSMTPQKSGLFTDSLKISLKRYCDEELEA
jgi:hypothetical protein